MRGEVYLPRLHPGQARVLAEARRFNVAMCGRRFGKTAFGKDLAVNAALDGKLVGWFAPTYKILNPAFDELTAVLQGVPGFKKSEQEKTLTLGGGGIECWSMDTPDPGRSRKYHLVIVDEAGLCPTLARIFNAAIRPTLADYQGTAWFLGTPQGVGDFAAFFAKGQTGDPEWRSWRLPTHENPFIRSEEIEAMRLGMPDSTYRQEILAEVVDNGEHPIGLAHIAACVGALSAKEPVAFGVDLARSVDFTVPIGLDEDGKVCSLDRWKSSWGETKEKLSRRLGKVLTYADSTGVGDPVVEDLQRSGSRIQGHVFTARFKQQMIENLITGIQQHRVTFPDGWLRAELDALRAEKTAVGTRYSAPTGTDVHDDGVMALALAWLAYTKTYHVPRPAKEVKVKQDDRAPHFDLVKRRFDRVDPDHALRQAFGSPRRTFYRPMPRRGMS